MIIDGLHPVAAHAHHRQEIISSTLFLRAWFALAFALTSILCQHLRESVQLVLCACGVCLCVCVCVCVCVRAFVRGLLLSVLLLLTSAAHHDRHLPGRSSLPHRQARAPQRNFSSSCRLVTVDGTSSTMSCNEAKRQLFSDPAPTVALDNSRDHAGTSLPSPYALLALQSAYIVFCSSCNPRFARRVPRPALRSFASALPCTRSHSKYPQCTAGCALQYFGRVSCGMSCSPDLNPGNATLAWALVTHTSRSRGLTPHISNLGFVLLRIFPVQ
jgi:hypothetical protein